MIDFFRDDLRRPLDVPRGEIAPGVAAAPAPAQPAPAPVVAGRWLCPGQGSILSRALPAGSWRVRWSAPVRVGGAPQALQASAERVLVQTATHWVLLDSERGEVLASGPRGRSEVLLDPSGERFYFERLSPHTLSAHSARDGREEFGRSIGHAGSFERTFLACLGGGRLAVGGVAARIAPYRPPDELGALELWSLGDPPRADDVGVLLTAERVQVLTMRTRRVLFARRGEGFALAFPGGVAFLDAELNVERALRAEFRAPERLSVDLDGRCHLLVQEEDGGSAYWLLSADGKLLARVPWDRARDGDVLAPPVLGPDHAAFLVSGKTVRALDPLGRLRWELPLETATGGASVTADGVLLLSLGGAVEAVRTEGGEPRRERLVDLGSGRLSTAPVLAPPEGRLLVAGPGAVHCCEAVGEGR